MKAHILTMTRHQFTTRYLTHSHQLISDSSDNSQHNNENNMKPLIIQFGWNLSTQFQISHLDSAVYIDCTQIQSPPNWLLNPPQQIISNLNQLIPHRHPNSPILIYNRNVEEVSIMPSCRLALVMIHYGIGGKVGILVGGYEGYLGQEGEGEVRVIEVEKEKENIKPEMQTEAQKDGEYPIIMGLQEFKIMRHKWQVVDTRTLPQYQGLTSGYSYWSKKGHIPKSTYHGGTLSKTNCQTKQYSLDGQFLQMWQSQKIDITKPIILYCGTGWRASEVMVYAVVHGVRACLYSNGWVEWSMGGEGVVGEEGQEVGVKQGIEFQVKCCNRIKSKPIQQNQST